MRDHRAGGIVPLPVPRVPEVSLPVANAAPVESSEYPVRLGSNDDFAAVAALLSRLGYEEATVARRLGGVTLAGVPRIADGRTTLTGPVEDGNAALVRLFLDGEPLPRARVMELLGDEGVTACVSLGLLSLVNDGAADLAATVMMTPVRGLWLASDLLPTGDGVASAGRDFVYSASNELTGSFLDVVPEMPGARALELCAGTGVAALHAVRRGASSAIASDLTRRAVHFARFNVRLNGMDDRVSVMQSDVWDALDGTTFDLIVAHPPYVPALDHRFDFRDAGGDGEDVTRRIIEGAPAHLARGGRLVVRAALSDRRGATIADRVRSWLGEASSEFDLVQLESVEYGVLDAYKGVTKGGRNYVDCERWLRHFSALEIERFAVCFLELRREAFGRAPITERRRLGGDLNSDVADWHFRWAHFMAGAGASAASRMAGQTPRVAPGIRVAVHLEAEGDGGWRTVGATIESGWPAHGLVKAPALAPTLLELCDGTRDVGALLEGLRAAGLVNADVSGEDVGRLVEVLATAGALELPACPLPQRPLRPVGGPADPRRRGAAGAQPRA